MAEELEEKKKSEDPSPEEILTEDIVIEDEPKSAEIKEESKDTEIKEESKDTEIKDESKDTEIKDESKDTEIKDESMDTKIKDESKDTETGDEPKAAGSPATPEMNTAEKLGAYYDAKAFSAQKKKKKLWKIIVAAVFTLLLIGYGVMTMLSYKYFQANTVINGVDYSFRTPDSVQSEIDEKVAGYQIHVKLRDGEIFIRPEDIGLLITTENDIRSIKQEQNPYLWFMGFFREEQKASYKITYDEDKLKSYLGSFSYFQKDKMIAPSNPIVEMASGKPVIKAGTDGTTFDVDKVIGLIKEMIPKMETELDVERAGCYLKAEYREDSPQVVECRARLERYTNLMLIYQYADINIQIKPNEIYEMLTLDTEDYYVVVSMKKVAAFVEKFAAKHDTFGTERIFKTHDGKKVKLTTDKIGWQIDQEEETKQLYRDISRFNSFIREPVFSNRAYAYTVDGSDIGTTYVEVDLTNQRAYFFKDGGLLLDCDIISGLPSRGNDTPGGFYVLNGLYRDCILRGPGYASHVDYWMPFNGGIGLHDASWQSKFGGELFKTRGSHGCVNLEYQMAQTVYEYGYKNMPVICYWRNSKYMVDEKDRIDDRKQQFFGL